MVFSNAVEVALQGGHSSDVHCAEEVQGGRRGLYERQVDRVFDGSTGVHVGGVADVVEVGKV